MLYLSPRVGQVVTATPQTLYLRDAQDAGQDSLRVWKGKRKSLAFTRVGIQNSLAGGESLYRLGAPGLELPE